MRTNRTQRSSMTLRRALFAGAIITFCASAAGAVPQDPIDAPGDQPYPVPVFGTADGLKDGTLQIVHPIEPSDPSDGGGAGTPIFSTLADSLRLMVSVRLGLY